MTKLFECPDVLINCIHSCQWRLWSVIWNKWRFECRLLRSVIFGCFSLSHHDITPLRLCLWEKRPKETWYIFLLSFYNNIAMELPLASKSRFWCIFTNSKSFASIWSRKFLSRLFLLILSFHAKPSSISLCCSILNRIHSPGLWFATSSHSILWNALSLISNLKHH